MRSDLAEGAEILVEMMKDDTDYQKYLALTQELEQDPELAARVHAFRRRNYELQNTTADPERLMWELNHEYQELSRIPLANAYLETEMRVCRMLQDVLQLIQTEIHIPKL